MTEESTWYGHLREKWRPERVRLLLIAESAPDDGGDATKRRFFYLDRLSRDNLFRSVVEALYGVPYLDSKTTDKRPWLERLRADGIYLIDLAPAPVNQLSHADREKFLRQSVTGCVDRALAIDPAGVILVKKNVHVLLAEPLRQAGLNVLHDRGISFPLPNTRAEFVRDFRAAASRLVQRPIGST